MAGTQVVVVKNDLIALAVKLRNRAEHVVAETVNSIESEVKAGESSRISGTVRTKRSNGGMAGTVTMGDKKRAIHAGFHEYGTHEQPGHPVMTPAAERRRRRFERDMAHLIEGGL